MSMEKLIVIKMSYAQKAMITRDMSLDRDCTWNVGQQFPHLRKIIENYLQYFGSENILELGLETGSPY